MQMGTLRIAISMLALLPLALFHLKKVPKNRWWHLFISGMVGNFIPAIVFALAQTRVDSALTGIINSTTPLFAFLIGMLFFSTFFSWLKLSGVLLGLTGTTILILYGQANPDLGDYRFALLILVATICYGTNLNFIKKYLQDIHPLTISSISFMLVGLLALGYLFTTDFITRIQESTVSQASLGYIAILAVIGTALASILFFWLTQQTDALFASTVTYLIPIVAIIWGLMDGEVFGVYHIIGMLLILGGVYLAGKRGDRFMQRLSKRSRHWHP